ncbi:MAG: hypothetical protein ACTSO6_09790 [Promethearchaeota archaeon]
MGRHTRLRQVKDPPHNFYFQSEDDISWIKYRRIRSFKVKTLHFPNSKKFR